MEFKKGDFVVLTDEGKRFFNENPGIQKYYNWQGVMQIDVYNRSILVVFRNDNSGRYLEILGSTSYFKHAIDDLEYEYI